MQNKAVHSLKTRSSMLVFFGMLLLSALIVLGVYKLTFDDAEHDARQQVAELVDAMEYSAAIALYAGDSQIADDVVRGVVRGSFVASVRLANDSGLDVKRNKYPDYPTPPLITRSLQSPFDSLETIGILEVALYPPEIRRRAATSAKKMAVALGSIVLFPTLLFWLIISRMISKPLLKLSNQLSTIVPGSEQRLSLPVSRHRDELSTLKGDINALLAASAASMRKERNLRLHIEALERQYEAIFTQASTGIALLDREGRCLIANPAVSDLFDDWHDQVQSVFSLLANWETSLFSEPEQFRCLLTQALNSNNVPQSLDLRLQRRTEDPQDWVHLLVSCHPDPEHTVVAECLFIDVSDRKKQEDEARFQSHHDALTQLLNRRGLEARLNLTYAARDNDNVILLLLDLDRFKQINDQWGHLAGDKVLIEIAKRMKTLVRGIDLLARLGGDEFLICIHRQSSEQAVHQFLIRLIDSLSQTVDLGDTRSDYVGASVGVAQYPRDGNDLVELLHKADAALYEVKHNGRNGYCIYCDGKLAPVILERT
ncbi:MULTISPECIES: sensor domain-containing diguanylate cyclase [Methylomonas]|uniref:Diguanylate cyclase n=2 Tax=Methylomonas TaxID=416 RepID=A0A140E401_9GAMM|nr:MULTISPECIES: sensor domain-containing diguanylate cyclase [Methylomonas]AMK75125.1 hypothetical protein JT25_001270 [Methylomonas denitrificans]OAI02614.1 hypothetical protein A1342_02260 [Methylomonas methanica]TCV83059.1 diguanylate cyclase (GGDEF)-like protein [Methylomonas methanica]